MVRAKKSGNTAIQSLYSCSLFSTFTAIAPAQIFTVSLSQTAAVLPTTSLPNLILPKLASTLISDLIILRHRSEHVTSPSF